ncbi:hypothetical protein EYF80_030323 [Liparis tanakae]|uniref:Uncharacterized protein n=1 Tax=Liparis tanakae TaxID=230148 RepID=A0A4Z2H0Y7_9TELE|nr:hypothetical protein EYF80_030323 [Liparis tanakae]
MEEEGGTGAEVKASEETGGVFIVPVLDIRESKSAGHTHTHTHTRLLSDMFAGLLALNGARLEAAVSEHYVTPSVPGDKPRGFNLMVRGSPYSQSSPSAHHHGEVSHNEDTVMLKVERWEGSNSGAQSGDLAGNAICMLPMVAGAIRVDHTERSAHLTHRMVDSPHQHAEQRVAGTEELHFLSDEVLFLGLRFARNSCGNAAR